jgi:hypothetical protein
MPLGYPLWLKHIALKIARIAEIAAIKVPWGVSSESTSQHGRWKAMIGIGGHLFWSLRIQKCNRQMCNGRGQLLSENTYEKKYAGQSQIVQDTQSSRPRRPGRHSSKSAWTSTKSLPTPNNPWLPRIFRADHLVWLKNKLHSELCPCYGPRSSTWL